MKTATSEQTACN